MKQASGYKSRFKNHIHAHSAGELPSRLSRVVFSHGNWDAALGFRVLHERCIPDHFPDRKQFLKPGQ